MPNVRVVVAVVVVAVVVVAVVVVVVAAKWNCIEVRVYSCNVG
jgi:hypothetical protein